MAIDRFVGVDEDEAEFVFEVEEARAEGGSPCFNAVLIYGSSAWVPVIALRTGSEKSVSVAMAVRAA